MLHVGAAGPSCRTAGLCAKGQSEHMCSRQTQAPILKQRFAPLKARASARAERLQHTHSWQYFKEWREIYVAALKVACL